MRIVMLGPPGAGKGTQAERLAEKLNVPHISTGDIFRGALAEETELGLKAKEYMDKGDLVPDEIVIGIVEERLEEPDCAQGFILDGFPRTIPQAEGLDAILSPQGLDRVINLEVEDRLLVERLTKRRVCSECGSTYHLLFDPPEVEEVCDECGGQIIQRDDDQEETVKNRLKVYRQQTAPLIDYYSQIDLLLNIDGEQGIEEVFVAILDELD